MFPSALAAAQAGVAIQQELAAQDVPARVGIHVGEVIVEPERLTGNAVNIAARIESFAAPGAVMLATPLYLCCEPGVERAAECGMRNAECGMGPEASSPIPRSAFRIPHSETAPPPGVAYRPTGYWYRQIEYLREMERGLDFREDLFNPGILRFALRNGETVAVIPECVMLVTACAS